MGAAVNMEVRMASRIEHHGIEKAGPFRMAALLSGLLPTVLLLLLASEVVADGNVTLESVTIYNTHEWFGRKPTVYFQCHEEGKVYLPDVVEKGVPYAFVGQESWQPLTTLHGTKCKRCGIYEEDTVKADDIFFEWELCPDAFSSVDGRHEVFQEKEFNATFICNDCIFESTEGESIKRDGGDENEDEGQGTALLILSLVLVFLVGLGVVAYTKWRQRQRAQQQARFVKMFEDDDDLDAELGLKDDL